MFVEQSKEHFPDTGAEAAVAMTRAGAIRLGATATHPASLHFSELLAEFGAGIDADRGVAEARFTTRRLRAGETLFRAGDRFDSIYFVRSGFFKTVRVQSNGIEQVMAFPGRGDALGLDGHASGRYSTDASALQECVVAVACFERLCSLGQSHPSVDRLLHLLFGREMQLRQDMIRLLGTMTAEARVAAFLLRLAAAFGGPQGAALSFLLPMSRQEIGSHLGIKLETVSRTLSALAGAGLIQVSYRSITLCDARALRALTAPRPTVIAGRRPLLQPVRRQSAPARRPLVPQHAHA
jgi:CRP/FNR family transcriptional regulator